VTKQKGGFDTWKEEYIAETERNSFLCSVLRDLELKGKRIVNPLTCFDLHFIKLYQISLLQSHGIPVPKTMITYLPEEVLKFRETVGPLIYKPCAGGASCHRLEDQDLTKERLELLKNAPVLFQECVEGDNIRVYMVGNEVGLCRSYSYFQY